MDIDPGFTQIGVANGDAALTNTIGRCESLFTFGQSIFSGNADVPDCGRRWLKTVPPVSLMDWPYVIEAAQTRSQFHMRHAVAWISRT